MGRYGRYNKWFMELPWRNPWLFGFINGLAFGGAWFAASFIWAGQSVTVRLTQGVVFGAAYGILGTFVRRRMSEPPRT